MAIKTDHGVGELSAIRPPRAVPNNLAVPLTSFVGRDAETAAARDLLARVRLLTLTGPGGAGKTRLALQVATGLADRFPDGIWWIDLAPLTAGEEVSDAAAAAVRAPTGPQRDALPALSGHLAGRRALLCLDNAEHVLDDVSRLAEAVLRQCPGITVFVTSREPLGVAGESVWRVPPLADDEAVALFYDRARLVRPDLVADAASDAAVRSIAMHLDGIPLALELAAAWLGTLTPQQIEGSLDDRFALLVRGPRGAVRRQATLAGSIDWSHALLDESERLIFRQLSVFVGSFGLDGVGAICADGRLPAAKLLPVLARLVDKSLVTTQAREGQARYRLLETLRAYGAARLVEAHETDAVRDRHLLWAVRAAEDIESRRDDDPDGWRRAMLLDYPNFRAALDHGLAATDPEPARRLAAALAWFWHLDRRGNEGLHYLRRAIDRAPEARTRLQARLLTAVALVADTAAPLDLEFDAATQAMALATEIGDEGLRALCLNLAAVGAFYTDFDAAWELCENAHQAAVAGDNTFVLGGSRALEALILHLRDQHAEAEALATDEVRHQLRTHRGVQSAVLGFQARAALAAGAPSRAVALAEQALRLTEPLADYLRAGAARSTLAYILTFTGDLDGARSALEPIMAFLDAQDAFVPGAATALGELSRRRGDAKSAASWFERDARSSDRGVETYLAAQALPALGRAQVALGRLTDAKATFDRAVAVAVATRLGMPAVLADALDGQSQLAATDPNGLQRALDLAHAALALRADHSLWGFVPTSLETVAALGSRANPTVDDVRVLAAAEAARNAMGLPRGADEEPAHRTTIEHLQAALSDAYPAAWLEGSKLGLQQSVDYARRGRGTRGRPSTGWDSLTRTEIEVVRLVTQGLTNPEIATLLFVSRGTVKTHLSHVFAKLAVSNRTELARLATTRLT